MQKKIYIFGVGEYESDIWIICSKFQSRFSEREGTFMYEETL